jgi:hypothetical protein
VERERLRIRAFKSIPDAARVGRSHQARK